MQRVGGSNPSASTNALVVQRIERGVSTAKMWVRFLLGALLTLGAVGSATLS